MFFVYGVSKSLWRLARHEKAGPGSYQYRAGTGALNFPRVHGTEAKATPFLKATPFPITSGLVRLLPCLVGALECLVLLFYYWFLVAYERYSTVFHGYLYVLWLLVTALLIVFEWQLMVAQWSLLFAWRLINDQLLVDSGYGGYSCFMVNENGWSSKWYPIH